MSEASDVPRRPSPPRNRDRLDRVVERLLERETLDEREVCEAAGIAGPAAEAPA